MNKAILILDEMPTSCSSCPVLQYAMEYEDVAYKYCGKNDEVICDGDGVITSRPTWCPLIDMPEYKKVKVEGFGGLKRSFYIRIDEILGGTDE